MSKDDVIEVEGKVVEVLRNATFIVELANNHKIYRWQATCQLYPDNERR